MKYLSILFFCSVCLYSCQPKQPVNPKIAKLKLLPGYEAEHLYSPSENKQGSWVAMTFDDKGRMITSDQYGSLYRLQLPARGSNAKINIEPLNIIPPGAKATDSVPRLQMGFAHGLLYAFNSLYVMVNNGSEEFKKHSGLYRLQDTNGDDQFDKITFLKSMDGEGEHGPHSIILSPDKKSIYVIAGNHTDVPPMDAYRLPNTWKEDNMFPLIKDPRGHAVDRMAPGGWIAKTDSAGSQWELISAGYRNPFDITFNEQGELFTYDSDMEWDFGTPWYRPTRICHVTSGSEFGWRTGNSKWSPTWPDNLSPVINIGQGSPTNLIHGKNSKFPGKYKSSLFASDWSFGIIYAVHLKAEGSSYTAEAEEFLSGSPLPLTDGIFGPDGSLYFLTGGRRLESDLYRVSYTGEAAAQDVMADEGASAREVRHQLEAFHGAPQKGAVDFAWPYLKHADRFIRYAARVAVEHQPVSEWQARALGEKDPQSLVQATIALTHSGKADNKNTMLKALTSIPYDGLTESQQVDVIRAFEIIISRFGNPDPSTKALVIGYLNSHYPAASNNLNRSLSKVLIALEAPGVVEKTLTLLANGKDDPTEKTASRSADLILRNPQYGMDIAKMLSRVPPQQQTYYAIVLSNLKSGWTSEGREAYFDWFKKAFEYKGGVSYVGYINKARQNALKNVPASQLAHYQEISGEKLLKSSGNDLIEGPEPEGPGRNWKVDEAVAVVENALVNRNLEKGKSMFDAARCGYCHSLGTTKAADIGPDLTQLGTRFSAKDMLEAIIEPNKTISDQYASTVFTMKDGSSVLGRIISEDGTNYSISQNPFTPTMLRDVKKQDVVGKKVSTISIMYPGLINSMNEEELKDLVAYLMSGGNPEHAVYKGK